jgi:hypothetical protein
MEQWQAIETIGLTESHHKSSYFFVKETGHQSEMEQWQAIETIGLTESHGAHDWHIQNELRFII